MIVPGVAVDTTHRIFTLANLATVWVEANVHEGDFECSTAPEPRQGSASVAGLPRPLFEGEVIYTGDLVEEQEPDDQTPGQARESRPPAQAGHVRRGRDPQPPDRGRPLRIPTSAMPTEGSSTFVFVKDRVRNRFDRREVDAEAPRGEKVTVAAGSATATK